MIKGKIYVEGVPVEAIQPIVMPSGTDLTVMGTVRSAPMVTRKDRRKAAADRRKTR